MVLRLCEKLISQITWGKQEVMALRVGLSEPAQNHVPSCLPSDRRHRNCDQIAPRMACHPAVLAASLRHGPDDRVDKPSAQNPVKGTAWLGVNCSAMVFV